MCQRISGNPFSGKRWQRDRWRRCKTDGSLRLILGWKLIILAFVLGCIIGSVVHVIRIKVSGSGRMLAMGPYLSAGIFIAHYGEMHGSAGI